MSENHSHPNTTPTTGTEPGPSRRWAGLAALVVALLTVGLDLMVLNVALPTLAQDLGASTTQLQWIVNAYTLVFAALMLPAGGFGDRYGRKRLLLIGLVAFVAASAWAAFSGSTGSLIAARAVMGIGAAIIVPLSLGIPAHQANPLTPHRNDADYFSSLLSCGRGTLPGVANPVVENSQGVVMAGIADKFDKAYEDKSLAELADAPVAALQGVSDGDAEKLQAAFNIKTVRDLGTNKFFLWAQAVAKLAE
ncbi:MFS transporter [Gordonia sp. AC31]|nr:MFS transporter [Gordonia sp. AC31]